MPTTAVSASTPLKNLLACKNISMHILRANYTVVPLACDMCPTSWQPRQSGWRCVAFKESRTAARFIDKRWCRGCSISLPASLAPSRRRSTLRQHQRRGFIVVDAQKNPLECDNGFAPCALLCCFADAGHPQARGIPANRYVTRLTGCAETAWRGRYKYR